MNEIRLEILQAIYEDDVDFDDLDDEDGIPDHDDALPCPTLMDNLGLGKRG